MILDDVPLRFAIQGMDWALDAMASPRPPAPQVSAGTVVFWACALDEELRRQIPGCEAARDAHAGGMVLPGLRFVRNALTHGSVITTRASGLEYPLFADGTLNFGPEIWNDYDLIVGPWLKIRSETPRQEAVYRAEVEHRELREPLERARAWFVDLRDGGWSV